MCFVSTQPTKVTTLTNNQELRQGNKVKNHNNSNWEEPYSRAVVTNTLDNQEGKIEIMPLEGKQMGEKLTEKPEDIERLKQKAYLCLIGMSYGLAQSKECALRNCLEAYDISEDREEPVEVWIAEVDRCNWSIRGMGSVHSTFIDNEEELEIQPDLAREIGNRAEDTKSLIHSAIDGVEPYREGHNYKVTENTHGW